ncbi:hypothetical protein [Sphingobium sp. RAC03]|nr:hypothetical protein [Sphingobium sp. RAC03]AOF98136.1 hypothetical protein BSY17_3 [Sphingobium sp. RAC03]
MKEDHGSDQSNIIVLGAASIVTRGAGGTADDGFNERKGNMGLTDD